MKNITFEFNNTAQPSRGKLLVSEPFMSSAYFKRSVVLLTEHNEEGTVGFIINKPTEYKLNKVIKDFPKFDGILYMGGPVNTDQLFYLHTLGKKIKGSLQVKKGLYWGGDFDMVKELIVAKAISENDIRFFFGYAGWDTKQLDSELKEKSWMVAENKTEFIMNTDTGKMWNDVIRSLGDEYSGMINYPEDPALN